MAGPPVEKPAGRVPLRGRRDMWQIPALLLGAGLLVTGVMTLLRAAPTADFDGALNDVAALIERQEYPEALERLNGSILAELSKPEATEEVRARFHALRGDAIYLSQKAASVGVGEGTTEKAKRRGESGRVARTNNENILNEYQSASKIDPASIDTRRSAFIAETLLDLGRVEEGLERARALPDEEAPRRHRLIKRVILAMMSEGGGGNGGGGGAEHGGGGGRHGGGGVGEEEGGEVAPARGVGSAEPAAPVGRVDELLQSLRHDPTLPEEDRLWVTARRAERKLLAGFPGAAIDEVIPEIQRLGEQGYRVVGELFLILGRAYLETGRADMARVNLGRAEELLGQGDELRGQVDVLLARITQMSGELEEARDRYATVTERFVGGLAQAQAFLGLGEVEADLSHYPESLAAFRSAIELGPALESTVGASPEELDLSMGQRYQARLIGGDVETALGYAELIVRAYPGDSAPAAATLRLAQTHLALAEKLLNEKKGEGEAIEPASIDPVTLSAIRGHFRSAGEEFQRHVQKSTVSDPELATTSLWQAADAFDRAGDLESAIRLFTDFMQGRGTDPRLYEARYRLARAFQARGEHATAIGLLEKIIADKPGSDEAFRSYVPMAQSFAQSEPPSNEKAEGWLLQVVDGRIFQPEAPQFREAIVELGRLYLRTGRYAEAIGRIGEALERYPAIHDRASLSFDLADANRLSAARIEEQLRDAMPLSERSRLEELRLGRLNTALRLYEEVRAALDARDRRSLSAVERVVLRNSVFYRGDCAFDLGQYETAIRYYDAAAQRYASDPATLVSMVQIVNCYAALGKWREASTAHERAQDRLRELPESAWKDGSVPMDRRHWERWLDASVRIREADPRADAAAGG